MSQNTLELNQSISIEDTPRSPQTTTLLEGVVAYLGPVSFADGEDWVGVRLTGGSIGLGKNDGTVRGKRYFKRCGFNGGLFVRAGRVKHRAMNRLEELRLKKDLVELSFKREMIRSRSRSRSRSNSRTRSFNDDNESMHSRSSSRSKGNRSQSADIQKGRGKSSSPSGSGSGSGAPPRSSRPVKSPTNDTIKELRTINEKMQEKIDYLTGQVQCKDEEIISLQRSLQFKEMENVSLQQSLQSVKQIDNDANDVDKEDAKSASIARIPPTSNQTTLNSKQMSNQSKILSLEQQYSSPIATLTHHDEANATHGKESAYLKAENARVEELVGEKEELVVDKKDMKKQQECVEKQLKEVNVEREKPKNKTEELRLRLEVVKERVKITDVSADVTDGSGFNGRNGGSTASTGIIMNKEDTTGNENNSNSEMNETDLLTLEAEDVAERVKITDMNAEATEYGGFNGGNGGSTASTGIIMDR